MLPAGIINLQFHTKLPYIFQGIMQTSLKKRVISNYQRMKQAWTLKSVCRFIGLVGSFKV